MKNKVLFSILSLLIFTSAAFGCYLAINKLNQKRHKLSAYYDQGAASSQNVDQKLIFLTKSDALVPTTAKKIEVAMLLLNKGEAKRAETYLLYVPNEQGDVLLAQYYLLNSPDSAQKYIDSIQNNQKKRELLSYQSLIKGNSDQITSTGPAETAVGTLINAINTQDYNELRNTPLLSKISTNINYKSTKYTQSLSVAQYFLNNNQPRVSIYVLKQLATKTGELPYINKMMAEAYSKLSDKNALLYIEKAISQEPENQQLYQLGIAYADQFQDNTRVDHWNARLNDIKNIQK
jgi:hypothetical protein